MPRKHKLPEAPSLPPEAEVLGINIVSFHGFEQTVKVRYRCCIRGTDQEFEHIAVLHLATHPVLEGIAGRLWEFLKGHAHEPTEIQRELRCESCLGACCTKFPIVAVMEDDLPALREATGLDDHELYVEGILAVAGNMGTAGFLGRRVVEGVEGVDNACIFMSWDEKGVGKCTIYEHRPRTCRSFPESGCGDQEPPRPELHQIRPFKKYPEKQRAVEGDMDLLEYIEYQPTIAEETS